MTIISLDEARSLVRQIAKSGGVALHPHCQIRMEERNVEMDDILYLLNWGEVGPNPIDETGERLLVSGTDIEGEPLRASIIFLSRDTLLVITVMS
jgi:hypothetical protein